MAVEWQYTTESLLAVLDRDKWRLANGIEEQLIHEVERLQADSKRLDWVLGYGCGPRTRDVLDRMIASWERREKEYEEICREIEAEEKAREAAIKGGEHGD